MFIFGKTKNIKRNARNIRNIYKIVQKIYKIIIENTDLQKVQSYKNMVQKFVPPNCT